VGPGRGRSPSHIPRVIRPLLTTKRSTCPN
jgi:hypothetical protein